MPRNGSGNYALPQPAFVAGTKIASGPMNSDMNDIASALTQSFSADGQTPFTGIFKNANGNSANPSYTFTSDLTSGLYLVTGGQLGLAAGSTQVASFQSSGATWNVANIFSGNITINGTSTSFGAGAANGFINGLGMEVDVETAFDGGGSVLTAKKIFARIPCALTVNTWSIMADQSGSVTIDILRANAGVPSSSIVGGGTKPNLSSVQDSLDNVPSSWTSTSLAKDDWLAFNITGTPSGVTFLTIALNCTRTAA